MYNKLFSKIVTSSIWLEPTPTRIVWLMFIALMNEDGFVQFASAANVAHTARINDPEADEAIKILEGPDPNSADEENDGRRIEKVPGGWMILNAGKYRDLVTREMVREQTRIRVARKRAKDKGVTLCNAPVTPSDTDTDTDTEKRKRRPLSLTECLAYAKTIGISALDAEAFFDSQESGGWTRAGKALKDWQASLRTWKANRWLPSQKQPSNSQRQFVKPKEQAPSYPSMPEKREVSDEEFEQWSAKGREEVAKLKEKFKP